MFFNFPEMHLPFEGIDQIKLPRMYTVRQKYDPQKIDDPAAHLRAQLERTVADKESYQGKRICITAGSRGIPDLDVMIRTICDVLKEWGAEPFIIPAMGSHGGATAEGQSEMIAGYGITEEAMGVPILSSMKVVQYAVLDGIPLYVDKYAYESDGIVIFNKMKPHTDFRGKHESGIAKMMAIGLANHKGASHFHTFGFASFARLIPEVCKLFLQNCPVAFGVGVVQNAYDEISNIEVCRREEFLEKDAELLEIAKEKIARFKFQDCDVLVIDEMGKNISGNGHDPNIVGRNNSGNFPEVLNLTRLVILGLTEETHHNGAGLGCVDLTTRKVLNDVDWTPTYINNLTAGVPHGGRIPMYGDTDREAILFAIGTCPGIDRNRCKLAHIRHTLAMETIEVSEALWEDIKDRDDVELISGPAEMEFDANDELVSRLKN